METIYNTATKEVLLRILELSERTAPVEISLGFVKNSFCHKGLVIKSAPPAVIKAIVNDPRVQRAGLETDGLHLECGMPKGRSEGTDEV